MFDHPIDEPLWSFVAMNSSVHLSLRVLLIHLLCHFRCCTFHDGFKSETMGSFAMYTRITHLHDQRDFHRLHWCAPRLGLLPGSFVPRLLIGLFGPDHSQDASVRSVAGTDSANAGGSSFVDRSPSQSRVSPTFVCSGQSIHPAATSADALDMVPSVAHAKARLATGVARFFASSSSGRSCMSTSSVEASSLGTCAFNRTRRKYSIVPVANPIAKSPPEAATTAATCFVVDMRFHAVDTGRWIPSHVQDVQVGHKQATGNIRPAIHRNGPSHDKFCRPPRQSGTARS